MNDYTVAAEEHLDGSAFSVTMCRRALHMRTRCHENYEYTDDWHGFVDHTTEILLDHGQLCNGSRYRGYSLPHRFVYITVTVDDDTATVFIEKNPDCPHAIPSEPPGFVFCYLPFTAAYHDDAFAAAYSQQELTWQLEDMQL